LFDWWQLMQIIRNKIFWISLRFLKNS